MKGTLFIISAPSCAGKTSLLRALHRGKLGSKLTQYTTYTTKQPREGDRQGVDFCFISREEFEQKIAQNFFIEWSDTYTNYYGTPRSIIDDLKAGISYTIILDRVGARQVAQEIPNAILIWIYVSDIDELAKRIHLRGQDSPEQVALRLRLAQDEIRQEKEHSFYAYHIKNDDFGTALGNLEEIITLHLGSL